MADFRITSKQMISMPDAPYQARHFIDGVYIDSADGRKSDRVSPSHGGLARQAANVAGRQIFGAMRHRWRAQVMATATTPWARTCWV